jgi:hypothetical protein
LIYIVGALAVICAQGNLNMIGCDIVGASILFAYCAYFIALVPFVLSGYYRVVHSIKLKIRDVMKSLITAFIMLAIFLISPIVFGGVHYIMGQTYCVLPWFRKDPILRIPISLCLSMFVICTLIIVMAYYWYYRYLLLAFLLKLLVCKML